MSGKLVIVGAGGHGKGTLEILRARRAAGLDVPEVIGFVDDGPAATGPVAGLPLLGPTAWLVERAGTDPLWGILALAAPGAKRRLDERLSAGGVRWATAVHPSVITAAGVHIEEGAIVGAGVVVAYDTRIGRHTTVNLNATVGHDCRIGDYSTVAPGVNITGHVSLGQGVEVQTNATIVPGLTLGDGARIGPGSVILRDVGPGEFYFGNPARKMPENLR
ncbi:MAG: acetyltransferase [Acidobacteriota bacterium]|nr:acetyltransferase [Acidobacteriota bacterium]MDQ7088882.1 acetyltransferase [Acidobacteriota bacterium]